MLITFLIQFLVSFFMVMLLINFVVFLKMMLPCVTITKLKITGTDHSQAKVQNKLFIYIFIYKFGIIVGRLSKCLSFFWSFLFVRDERSHKIIETSYLKGVIYDDISYQLESFSWATILFQSGHITSYYAIRDTYGFRFQSHIPNQPAA